MLRWLHEVANELMTRILNEDLRDRTSRATDTTKFLAREVQRLQAENSALDTKIAQLRLSQGKPASSSGSDQPTAMLDAAQGRTDPEGRAVLGAAPCDPVPEDGRSKPWKRLPPRRRRPTMTRQRLPVSRRWLPSRRALQKNLDAASAKLAAARLGENLEKDQQSEKLEIIEQPTVPQEPIKPNRLKVLALAFAAALLWRSRA